MQPSLDDVRRELAEIHDRLLALPVDDYEQRTGLKDRQNELRQLSFELLEGEPLHDRENLRAAYERMSRLRDRLLDQHLRYSSTSVGDAGIDGAFTEAINRAIDSGLGIDQVEARLQEILRQMRSSR